MSLFNDDFLNRQASPNSIDAKLVAQQSAIKQLGGNFVQVNSLSEIAQAIGEIQYQAIDTSGKLRMIMSAIDLFNVYGIHAHLAGFDINGAPQFWLSADDGSAVFGAGSVTLGDSGMVINDGGDGIIFYDSAYGGYSIFSFRPNYDGGASSLRQLVFTVDSETNQISNGDFETGNLSSWTETDPDGAISVAAGQGVNDGFAVLFADTATISDYIQQNTGVTCTRGIVVTLQARSAVGGAIYLLNGTDTVALEVPALDEYRTYIEILPSSTTYLKIYIPSTSGAVYIDNIKVRALKMSISSTPASEIEVQDSNLDIHAGNVIRLFAGWGGITSAMRVDLYKTNAPGMIFNVNAGDYDVQFKGSTDDNMLYLDSGNNRVGVGTAAPGYKFDVNGDVNIASTKSYRINGVAISTEIPLMAHGNSGTIAASTTNYLSPPFSALQSGSVAAFIPTAGTLKDFYLRTVSAQPASGSLVCTVQINGSDTAITFTVAASGGAGNYSDTTHSVSVASGDRVGFKLVNNATGASAQIGAMALGLKIDSA